MAKRKPKTPKLKLVDNSSIGLTPEQAEDLHRLYWPLLKQRVPFNFDNNREHRRALLNRSLAIYVELLCYDAKLDHTKTRKKRQVALRRKILKDIKDTYGYDMSPADIIKALARHAPVPDYAKNAILRDYLRVTV